MADVKDLIAESQNATIDAVQKVIDDKIDSKLEEAVQELAIPSFQNVNVSVADDEVQVVSEALPLEQSAPISASSGGCSGPLIAASSTFPNDSTSGLVPPVSGSPGIRPTSLGHLAGCPCFGDWGQTTQRDRSPNGPTFSTLQSVSNNTNVNISNFEGFFAIRQQY